MKLIKRQLKINKVYNCDCEDLMCKMHDEFIDLVVTSPPYDNLRTYNGTVSNWSFNKFKTISEQLYRVVKSGGVVIWVVSDSTIKGSESGTSFKQALYFKDIGFNLYDTMIYQKQNYLPLTHRRYEQEFEYMFCLTKGTPKTFNPIMIPCKYAGTKNWGTPTYHKTNDSGLVTTANRTVKDFKQHGNIFCYLTNKSKETKGHPAPFPEQLAKDMITTWSNESDLVFDPFSGSGTTLKIAAETGRNFIGSEIEPNYFLIAKNRITTD